MKEKLTAAIGKLLLDLSHASNKEQLSAAIKKAFEKMHAVVLHDTTSYDNNATDNDGEATPAE